MLDIGCGNGASLIRLATAHACRGIGFDFSARMIAVATAAVRQAGLDHAIAFHHRAVPPVPTDWGAFDLAYSQRSLINLETRAAQRAAVLSVADTLLPGGRYIMIECFNDGGEETNLLRRRLGLEAIAAPWHNLFFDLAEVKSWSTPQFYVERVVHISSTYHFLSRVVYAKLAQQSGEALRYDSEINLIAAQLPQEIGTFGPVKACIWRKAA
ncbi:MAG: class I SAM-dependent methyltransferase [Proteobacteria bacterium]|nr:class I SAM-dependent methyltransferase [Pseudomonadota bacterium]